MGEVTFTDILTDIFSAISVVFSTILQYVGSFITFMFDWQSHPYNVVIAIPLALMIIVFSINIVRRLIDGF